MDFINWLVTSSADPLKFSLAIRGLLALGGGWLLHASVGACGLGVYCLGIDGETINQGVQVLTNVAYAAALSLGAVMTAIGFVRKLINGQWSAA
jgi:hypothetical protein